MLSRLFGPYLAAVILGRSLCAQVPISNPSPRSVDAGGAAFQLTVAGSDFVQGSIVRWDGTPLTTAFAGPTKLTATVPASAIALAGASYVAVANPGGATSVASLIEILPVLKALTPTQVPAGNAAAVTATGVGFGPTCSIWVVGFGSMTSTYVNSTTLTAIVVPAAIGSPGNQTPLFVGCGGTSSRTLQLESKSPSITAISPNSAPAGSQPLTITLDGSFFVQGALLIWNGDMSTAVVPMFVNSTRLTATVPASFLANPKVNTVTVQLPGGISSNGVSFTVGIAQLALYSISPNSAVATGNPILVTLTGTGFTRDAVVEWNGASLSGTSFESSTKMYAGVTADLVAVAGTVAIDVRIGASVSNRLQLTVSGAPATPIQSVYNLASGLAQAPGSLVSIYGWNLAVSPASASGVPAPTTLNGTFVRMNGIPVPLLYVSPRQINAQVPFEVPVGAVEVVIQVGDQKGTTGFVASPTGPGIWRMPSSNHVLGVNLLDGSLNSVDHPTRPGEYVTLYLTGQGAVTNPVATGAAAPDSPLSFSLAPVSAKVGGVTANVLFAGLAPGFIGLLQLNLQIPDIPTGERPVEITIGKLSADTSMISIGAN